MRSVAKTPESQEHQKSKRCSSSSSSSEMLSDSINIELSRDGSVRETDACALPFDAFISVAPAHAVALCRWQWLVPLLVPKLASPYRTHSALRRNSKRSITFLKYQMNRPF